MSRLQLSNILLVAGFSLAVAALSSVQLWIARGPAPRWRRYGVGWLGLSLLFAGLTQVVPDPLPSGLREVVYVLAALTAGTGLLLGGWWVGRFPIERCEPVLGLGSLLLIYAVIVQAGVALGSVLLPAAGMSGVH